MTLLLPLVIGYFLDLLLGDPFGAFHPVCLIGTFISKCEKFLRKFFGKTPKAQLFGGFLLTVFTLAFSFFIPFFILKWAKNFNIYLYYTLATIFCYQILATKSLKDSSMEVYKAVKSGSIEKARYAVSMIVGRDTKSLSFERVIKAAVETVAENTTDGVIAPMIFMAIGGAPLGFLYKAVNTLDSMVGYKNDKYLYFGRFSAKTDDVFNFIPAIISAYLMIFAAFLLKLDWKNAYKIYRRDRRKSTSPNSGRTETVAAGALGVELLGDTYYFGKLYKKPAIGDSRRKIVADDIITVNKMMYRASFAALCLITLIYLAPTL